MHGRACSNFIGNPQGKMSKRGKTKEVDQALLAEHSLLGKMSKQGKTKECDRSSFASPYNSSLKYCNYSKDYNAGLGKMSKQGKMEEVGPSFFAEPQKTSLKYCSYSKHYNAGLGKMLKQERTKEVGQSFFAHPQKNSLKYCSYSKDYNAGLGKMSKQGKMEEVGPSFFAEPQKTSLKYCSYSKHYNARLGKMSNRGKTKEVGQCQSLFADPQKNSLTHCSYSKDYNVGIGKTSNQWNAKEVHETHSAKPQKSLRSWSNPKDYNICLDNVFLEVFTKVFDQNIAKLRIQLVNEPNKAPAIPLPVSSMPMPVNEMSMPVAQTTAPCSNQPGPSAKPNHCTIGSTPSTGANPEKHLVDGAAEESPAPVPVLMGTSKSKSPSSSRSHDHEKGPENEKEKEKGELNCTICSTPSIDADPEKNSVDVATEGSSAPISILVGTSKSKSPSSSRSHGHEKGPENDKGKEKGESSASMSARIKRTPYGDSEYPLHEAALQSIRQMTEKLELLRAAHGRGRCDSAPPNARAGGPVSALIGGVGEDSFELYKKCLLERDQAILTEASLTQVEEEMAHSLMQSVSFTRQLTLQAVLWKEKEAESNAKVEKLQAELKKAEEALALATSQMKEGFAKHKEEMALKDQELAMLSIETDKEKERQLELGKRVGREDFLQSEEFQTMLKKARHDGVCDFKKSPEFVVLSQAVDRGMTAFTTCQAQLQKLGGLNEGLDLSQLNAVKTENLKDNPVLANNDEKGAKEARTVLRRQEQCLELP